MTRKERRLEQRHSCPVTGKIVFVSRRKARAAIKAVLGSGKADMTKTGVFEPYYCPGCTLIHIGHNRAS